MTKTKTIAAATAILFAFGTAAFAQSQGAGSSNSGPNAGSTQPGMTDTTRDNMGRDNMAKDKMGTKSGTSSTTTGQSGQMNPETDRTKKQNMDPQKKM